MSNVNNILKKLSISKVVPKGTKLRSNKVKLSKIEELASETKKAYDAYDVAIRGGLEAVYLAEGYYDDALMAGSDLMALSDQWKEIKTVIEDLGVDFAENELMQIASTWSDNTELQTTMDNLHDVAYRTEQYHL